MIWNGFQVSPELFASKVRALGSKGFQRFLCSWPSAMLRHDVMASSIWVKETETCKIASNFAASFSGCLTWLGARRGG